MQTVVEHGGACAVQGCVDLQLGSDDEEDEYTVVTQPPLPCEVTDTHETTKNDGDTAEMSVCPVVDEKSMTDMEDWLRQNVVVQYWRSKCESRLNSTCRFSNIAVDWFVIKIHDSPYYECRLLCL